MLKKFKEYDANFKKEQEEKELRKELEQLEKLKEKYNLHDIEPEDLKTIQAITTNMAGSGLLKAGVTLSNTKAEERLKIGYLNTLVEQNWLIINQLSRLLNKLEE